MYDFYAGGAETQFRMLAEKLISLPDVAVTFLFENLDHDNSGQSLRELRRWNATYFNLKFSKQYTILDRVLLKFKIADLPYQKRKIKIEEFLKEHNVFDWVITYNYTFVPYVSVFHKYKSKLLFSERNDGQWLLKIKNGTEIIRECDVVTCNSETAKELIQDQIGIEAFYIKNGVRINLDDYHPKTNAIKSILIPARISPEKNQQVVIGALKESELGDIRLVLCGGISSQEYYSNVKAKVRENNLQDRVSLEGFQNDMKSYYWNAGCVVLPSYYEGTPNAILEAYALGVPVIASNIPMNMPLFENQNLLFSPDSAEEFMRAFLYLASMSMEERTLLTQRNYEYVKNEYSVELICDVI